MRIATIGRGTIGGTLATLWRAAGHEVTELGRGGGDVTGADVALLAVPVAAVGDALSSVRGLGLGTVVIDATNRLGGEAPPEGHASVAEYVRSRTGGPVAKAFNLNFGKLLGTPTGSSARPSLIWVGDEEARAAVEELVRDAGLDPVHGGPLTQAATQEAFAAMLMAITRDVGEGVVAYRFAPPERL